jgi:UDP-N-acetylglucosamine diphosphorylase/glucosamine-1-phosphate N-acetyltransferase
MPVDICIFEDESCVNFNPLVLNRPVYDLRCGMTSLKDKISRQFPNAEICLHCRGYLAEVVREENPDLKVNEITSDRCLFINGRLLADSNFKEKIDLNWQGVYRNEKGIVAALLQGPTLQRAKSRLSEPLGENLLKGEKVRSIEAKLVSYPWDLIHENTSQIEEDFKFLDRGGEVLGEVHPNATLLGRENIYIGTETKIRPGAVLDAENGPIYIGENATVFPNAVIEGPVFVGDSSLIKIGAKICEGTSIGEVCKVGGEVEESIIHSYSNKQHEGFLGHAYIAMWVNLGADTNNSDLKNNYGPVKVYLNGKMVDSGSIFVGLFTGDHAKSGINTMFNTGTVVGVMSNVFGGGYPPKFIPSFSWGGSEGLVEYELEKALETARRVMGRRKKQLTPAQERVLREVFRMTAAERAR